MANFLQRTAGISNPYASVLNLTNATDSTTTATGALVTSGGIGATKSINAGSNSSNHVLNGNVILGSTNSNTHGITGNLTIGNTTSAAHSIIGNLTIGNTAGAAHSIIGSVAFSTPSANHTIAGTVAISKPLTTAGQKSALSTKSANYTTTANDEFILVDATSGARTITLLSAATAGAGTKITVIKTDSSVNTVTVTSVTSGGTLATQYESGNFVSNGTNWFSY